MIANCQSPIANSDWQTESAFGSRKCLETRRRGQGAECPDRFITKKRLIARRFFFGITPAPQYSVKLTTQSTSVKPTNHFQCRTANVQGPRLSNGL
jgi:hypothetical protein